MKNKSIQTITPNVLLLGIVSFLNDFSSEMIMPILPMFISSLGGTGLVIGIVGGLRDSISSILKVFSGYWSDKTGKRKIFVWYGYSVSGIFKLLLSFSPGWGYILAFSSLERIGKGLRTAPRDAIISDSMPTQKGKGFGIHRALDSSGAILGAAFAFILFWFLGFPFKSIIFAAAVLAGLSLIPLSFVKEKKKTAQDISLRLSLAGLPKPLKLFLCISGIFSLANISYMFFILRTQEFFSGKLSIGVPILLYILFNIFYAFCAVPFGMLSDKIGRKNVLIFGYSLFSLTCFGFAFLNSLAAFIILFALYGVIQAAVDANQRAFVSDLSSDALKATALGGFHTVIGGVALAASFIAGLLWQRFTPGAAFIYAGIVSIIAVILFFMFGSRLRN